MEYKSLEELIEKNSSITYGVVKPGDEDENGVLFIRGGDVINGKINIANLRTITKEVSQQYQRTLLRGGELLISLVGNPGEVAIVPEILKNANIARQVGLVRLDSIVDKKYVMYYLISPNGKEELTKRTLGTVQRVINLKDLKTVKIPLSPLPHQQKIASILGALDDKIEINNQMNQTLETMAKALFKSWFVDFEPFADGEFEESELGMIPKGWKIGKFNALCKILNGYAFKSQWWQDEGVKVVKIKNIDGTKVNIDDCQCVSEELAKQNTKFLLQDGDMLIAMTGATVGKVGVVNTEGQKLLLNQRVGKFIPIKIADAYIKTFICEDKFFDAIQNRAYGSAQPNISAGDIENMKIIIPNEQALENFERSVSPMFQQILENNKQTSILRKTRDSLIPKLMSGEIELAEV